MKIRWSIYNIFKNIAEGYLVRNTFTGSVCFISEDDYQTINNFVKDVIEIDDNFSELIKGGILVESYVDEGSDFFQQFLKTRNNTDTFTIHLLTTLKCQLSCSYCFENGADRNAIFTDEVLDDTIEWFNNYFINHKLKRFKVVLFGGEPLLRFDIVKKIIPALSNIAKKYKMEFLTEVITNGVFLTDDVASFLSKYSLNRIQITLDGTKDVHDKIRFSSEKKGTFDKIIKNIKMILDKGFIDAVDLRLSCTKETLNDTPKLIEYISRLGYTKRINLSLGIIIPTIGVESIIDQKIMGNAYVSFLKKAKDLGFEIPIEYVVGPWCVATEQHTIILQPDGKIQKCNSTVGRDKYDFSHISKLDTFDYPRDERFELFGRMNQCIVEKCEYLPICGGGCHFDSVVQNGDDGFAMKFCQKELLETVNKGLLEINFT